jgi:hypothetical protein
VNWNCEKNKNFEIISCEIFECEGHSDSSVVENCDWLSDLSSGENIWNIIKRSRTLRYGDCVLGADCVRGIFF